MHNHDNTFWKEDCGFVPLNAGSYCGDVSSLSFVDKMLTYCAMFILLFAFVLFLLSHKKFQGYPTPCTESQAKGMWKTNSVKIVVSKAR